MNRHKILYYSDSSTDDFAGTNIRTNHIGEDFCYIHHSFFWKAFSALLYYCVALPLVWIAAKVYLGIKIENRDVLRGLRHTGYYLYGNHTRVLDAYVPPLVSFPKRSYFIAGPDVVSIPGIRNLVMLLGALPIPTEFHALNHFIQAVSYRVNEKHCIAVYPEAHVWPFYTGIRPFAATSFYYPVKDNVPAVAMVTTYRKRSGLFFWVKKPGMTITLSSPMYPDLSLPRRKAQEELQDKVFLFMKETSEGRQQPEYIQYIYRPKEKM